MRICITCDDLVLGDRYADEGNVNRIMNRTYYIDYGQGSSDSYLKYLALIKWIHGSANKKYVNNIFSLRVFYHVIFIYTENTCCQKP